MAWGRRRAAEGEPAPPLPAVQVPEGEPSSTTEAEGKREGKTTEQGNSAPVVILPGGIGESLPDYQILHFYKTPEELAAAVKFRNESLGKVPVPWVLRPRPEKK
jgi:hypothetical protein